MAELLRILIVEDSPAMRQLLSLAVRRHGGVEVQEAADGLAALKLLSSGTYDLMFVDLNMPVLDGMKLIRRVRESEAALGTDRLRICVVTTESAQATEDQARALGADYFVRKPVSRRDVERILAEAFPA
jgi:two-component system, chemotaxis family, chemotaxis protein CheY